MLQLIANYGWATVFRLNGKNFENLTDHGLGAIAPGMKFVKVTPSDDPFVDGACRALWVGSEGTANIIQIDGTVASGFPLFPGLNRVAVAGIKAGGTASDIWAVY